MKSILAAALVSTFSLAAALPAQAQVSFNAGATSDYRYRGISQTRLKPALQAGIDYAHDSGFYLGAWGSTIKWIKDAGGDAGVEVDLYGGYKTEISKGLSLDIGLLSYQYPSNKLNPSANTTELYGALSYGPVTAKYSHSTSNLFGFADSKGSGYLDLSASFDLGDGLMLAPHLGYQRVKRNSAASYTDYSLTLSKAFDNITVSGALVGTDTDAYVGPGNKDLGKSGLVLAVKAAF